jgi:CRISPR/Cas system-associated endonuclease/helicase Cas3
MDDQGIFTLTVPTGGGKPLASLRFAFLHAQKAPAGQGDLRLSHFTSIIDQNADVARKYWNRARRRSIVLEHTLQILPLKDTEDETRSSVGKLAKIGCPGCLHNDGADFWKAFRFRRAPCPPHAHLARSVSRH